MAGAAAAALVAAPLIGGGYIEFQGHANKRGNDQLIAQGQRLLVQWGPVSKLDVFGFPDGQNLLFSIDGGSQSSWLARFDGDFPRRREYRHEHPDSYFAGTNSIVYHLWNTTRNAEPEVLVIGPSAGGDVRQALSFGADSVDAVELVGAIIAAESQTFAEFGSAIYAHPKVNAVVGEGRSFLRAADQRYDIIQMFSNQSTASVIQGSNAMGIAYLQTVEAYREYFAHLTENGVLQINHHVWPRMLTTAAQAWHRSGRTRFWRHALVIETRSKHDTLPTFMVKMQPWTQREVDIVLSYVNRQDTRAYHMPAGSKPSRRIYAEHVLEVPVKIYGNEIKGIQMLVGTYHQAGLPYDVGVEVLARDGRVLRSTRIDGAQIQDNSIVTLNFTPLHDVAAEQLLVRVSAPSATHANGFSVWMAQDGRPSMRFFPEVEVPSGILAFNPVDPSGNLVPNEFLGAHFPYQLAAALPWDITPVTDIAPFFNMFRKRWSPVEAGPENMLDRNTAYLLERRMENGYPGDWIHLIVVAAVSLAFSLIFIAVPLLKTSVRGAAWPGMSRDIIYFSCLGLGFIMFEVVFIQLFQKLIGFPPHTFVLVISTMLLSAGLGSICSRKVLAFFHFRPRPIFGVIVLYALVFIFSFQSLFHFLLAFPLPVRLVAGAAMIAPMAFFMGMAFPIGLLRLGRDAPGAIPWAWGLNGFCTVLGGYLAIVVALLTNFVVVLGVAALIYGCALIVVRPPEVQL
ncbi:MAG: hypothetical protein L0H29_07460, partial [Sinobacteraceae bacterium]|nr:hypothetical protein [Nevskiaceae bacterium]